MRPVILPFIFAVFLITFISAGCQGGPVVPDPGSGTDLSLPRSTSSGDAHHCLGYYTLVVDTENQSLDVLHARSGDLHLNVVNVLNTTMGIGAVGVPSEHDPATGLFVFDITLTHPFGTKPQLGGFDVKGILMTPGSLNIAPLVFAGIDETRLENADGYTRWWNPTEFTAPGLFGYTDGALANASSLSLTATINPYKYFADSLSATDTMSAVYAVVMDADNGRGVFTAGNSNTRRYRIRFPMDPGPQVVFGYAVDASWKSPTPNPPSAIPDDFPINANQPEAYYVAVNELVNTLYYDTETGNAGGVLRLHVSVHDWQGQDAGDIPVEVEVLKIFAPDLMSGSVDGEYFNDTAIKAHYSVDLFGVAVPSEVGEALVAVRAGCAGDATYDQGSAPAPPGGISAWNVISVDVVDPECSTDDNNDFADAVLMTFGEYAIGAVCPPDDITDFFYFNIPLSFIAADEINFYSDAAPTTITLYDQTHNILLEETVSGMTSLSFDTLTLLPGDYYIGIAADPTEGVHPYFLELDADYNFLNPCSAYEVTPSTLFMDAYHVWMDGNYAYLTGYYGVWVYDISDPANPVQTGYVDVMGHEYACFQYPYAYGVKFGGLPGEKQLDMIDFSDPFAPIVHEDLDHYYESAGSSICMDDEYLCVRYGTSPDWDILIYDIGTNPAIPVEVTSIDCTYAPMAMELTEIPIHGKYLVVGGAGDIRAYSVEDLWSITELPFFTISGNYAMDIVTDEDWIYLTYNGGSWDGFLYSLRLDPLLPGFVWGDGVDLPGASYKLILDGSYAYIADGSPGLSVCDISDPEDITYGYTVELIGYGRDLYKDGDTLCILPGSAGLEFFDMTDPTDPQQYPHLLVCNQPIDSVLIGDYLFVVDRASSVGAILTVDISEPANAFVAAEMPLPGEPGRIDGFGTRLLVSYIGDPDNEWMLVNADDPLSLSVITSVPEADWIGVAALTPDAVYIGTNFPEVLVYDYSSLPPSNVGGIMIADTPREIAFGLDHMYVSTWDGVEVLSLDNPLSPVYEGVYPVTALLREAAVAGKYLYMVYDDTLEVADLTDPSFPIFLTSIVAAPGGDLEEIAIDGQFAYAAGVETPSCVIQRLPEDTPTVLCNIHDIDDYDVEEFLVGNGYLYEFCRYTGIHIYDLY